MDGLAHVGIEVHGVDEVYVGIFLREVFHCRHHTDETVAEVLATVAGDEHEFFAIPEAGYVVAGSGKHRLLLLGEGAVALELLHHPMQGVNHGVAGDENLSLRHLLTEILRREGRGSKIVGGDAPGELAIHLLGPWAIDVVSAQPCLHMSHGYLLIEGGKGGGGGGGGVAMHEHHVGFRLAKHVAHTGEHTRRNVVEVLTLLHDVKVVVGGNVEDAQHLVEHLAMLPGDTHYSDKLVGTALKLLHQRSHLDGFRAGAEHKHYSFHII